jgi:hypothetical protein
VHVRRGFLGWGVFLILAGAVPLAVRAGYLTDDQIGRLWTLWPLILIGIGIGLILGRTRFAFIGGLIVAATLGLMAGGLLSSGVSTFSVGACGQDTGTVAFPASDGTFPSAGGSVDVQLDCGDLTVGVVAGNAWRIEGKDAKGTGPRIDSTETSVSVRPTDSGTRPFSFLGGRDTWQVNLPDAAPLDLDLQVNAGQATIGLAGATVGEFGLDLNAGSSTVDLGSAKGVRSIDFTLNAGSLGLTLPNVSMTGEIHANAGAVKLCAPPGAALQLHAGENIIASYDYAGHGLVQSGSTWTTPGFDTAAVRIELRTEANAGSFVLDPEGGCG